MRRALALAALAVASGCGGDGIVDLTIALDSSVTDAEAAQVRSLTMDVTGSSTETVSDPIDQPFAVNRQERMIVRSPAGGAVTLAVTARDAGGAPLLFGQTSFTLSPGSERAALVTLSAALPPGDGGGDAGADLAGGDLAGADLAGGDLAGSDLPPPSDLASADLAPIACPAGVLLCEGFETGAVDALRWDATNPAVGGTIALDNTRAHRGQYSLHAHLNAVAANTTATAQIGEGNTFTPTNQSFYVRAFVYYPTAAQNAVPTLLDSGQNVTPYRSVSLSIDHDALAVFDDFQQPSNYNVSTTPKVPLDAWSCLELEVNTGTTNSVHALVNGTVALAINETTVGTPGVAELQIGLAIYPPNAATGALDVWIDDIIVDSAPIGCAK